MIIKQDLKNNFCIVSNMIIRDKNLSGNAKLLAVFLSSLPSEWKVYVNYIAKELNMGLRTAQRAFKELIDMEYIQKIQIMDEKTQKFTNAFTIIFTEKVKEITQDEEEMKQDLEEENEEEQEAKKELENAYKIENEQVRMPILNEFERIENEQKAKNRALSPASKMGMALFCRTYIRNEFLQSKNLFLMKSTDKNFHIFYKKAQNQKEKLDLHCFTEFEKDKINEWFKYKARIHKKPLNILSKQFQVKKLEQLKGANQNIIKLIENSITNGWKGIFAEKKAKVLNAYAKQKEKQEEALKADLEWLEKAKRGQVTLKCEF